MMAPPPAIMGFRKDKMYTNGIEIREVASDRLEDKITRSSILEFF